MKQQPMYVWSSGPIGPSSYYYLQAQCWSEKHCDRVIQHLRLIRDWLEQDEYEENKRDQWFEGMSA